MDSFDFFLLIDCFKDNIRVITINRWIFIVEKFKTLFKIKLVVHRKRRVTHLTPDNSPLVGISRISRSGFSFGINPHSDAVNMHEAH